MAGLADLLVPAHYAPWDDFVSGLARELWMVGGRGSVKSTTAGYMVASTVMAHPRLNAMVLRKHKEDLKNSVFPQIQECIERLDRQFPEQHLSYRWRARMNPLDLTFDGNRSIVFHGLDDPRKRKSEKPPLGGYFGCMWLEELDEFAGMDELGSLRKSVLRGGPIGQSIYTFNPPMSSAAWVNAEAARAKPGRRVYRTTYLDVAKHHPEWLGESWLADAEDLRLTDERRYRYELLGEAIGTGGEIFTNLEARNLDVEAMRASGRFEWAYGLDFGFKNDPTALTCLAYDPEEKTQYVFDEWYHYGPDIDDVANALAERGLRNTDVVADCEDALAIKELRRRGFRIRECYKSPDGWRDAGFRWERTRRRIVIDTRNAPNTWREASHWEWGRYANGDFKTEYPKGNDHSLDSMRYGSEVWIKRDMAPTRVVMPRGFKRGGV